MDSNNNQSEIMPENRPVNEEPAVIRAAQAWRNLGVRLRSITPSALLRGVMFLGVIAGLFWLGFSTWPALAPFAIGGIIAYVLLPVVDMLDRVMPRGIAVLLTLAGAIGIVVFVVAQLVPVINSQITYVYANLPDQQALQEIVEDLNAQVETLPAPIRSTITEVLQETANTTQAKLDRAIRNMVDMGFSGVFTLLNTIGFVLGFLVIPAWMLDVLRDQKRGKAALNKQIPQWARPDFWAVLRIIDRPFRAFTQGQFILSLATGLIFYLAMLLLETVGILDPIRYRGLIAVLVGMLQLIPLLGPIVAAILLVFLGLIRSTEVAAIALMVHIAVQYTVNSLVAPRLERRYIDIHPALLVMVIVLLSEFGLLWVMVAAPIAAVMQDLFRYTYGRLDNPPKPAGVLPKEQVSILNDTTLFAPFIPTPAKPETPPAVPVAYRHGRAARSSNTPTNQSQQEV